MLGSATTLSRRDDGERRAARQPPVERRFPCRRSDSAVGPQYSHDTFQPSREAPGYLLTAFACEIGPARNHLGTKYPSLFRFLCANLDSLINPERCRNITAFTRGGA